MKRSKKETIAILNKAIWNLGNRISEGGMENALRYFTPFAKDRRKRHDTQNHHK